MISRVGSFGRGVVRDSKNPGGSVLRVELNGLLAAVKAGYPAR